jgi:hypothetical protein
MAASTKSIMLTILDTEGKIYRNKLDVSNKKIPTFTDYQIPLNLPDQICSVSCNGSSLYCTTTNGKVVVININ